jgi:NADH-quinone oxidoreductase subunit J
MDNLHPTLFWLIAGVTGLSALATLLTQNIVRSATWLLFTLAGTAGIFFLLGADFVAATQILIYVGGTLVLVVFGVMLTAQGPFITMKTTAVEWGISMVVGMLLLGVLSVSALAFVNDAKAPPAGGKNLQALKAQPAATANYTDRIGLGFLGGGVGPKHKTPDGHTVRASYLLPFEIVSVHLLVVLIGAAYLARAKRRREPLHE